MKKRTFLIAALAALAIPASASAQSLHCRSMRLPDDQGMATSVTVTGPSRVGQAANPAYPDGQAWSLNWNCATARSVVSDFMAQPTIPSSPFWWSQDVGFRVKTPDDSKFTLTGIGSYMHHATISFEWGP